MMLKGKSNEFLRLELLGLGNNRILEQSAINSISILWIGTHASRLMIDGEEHYFASNQIVCLTEFHKIEVLSLEEARLVQFNHPFCCIKNLDDDVSGKGLLFYSASPVPVISVPEEEVDQLESLWKMFEQEMNTRDNFQFDILQIILKRFIIFCARLFKNQKHIAGFQSASLTIIREFNYLVEVHFRNKHAVSEYAAMLSKSPKTLSNLFAHYNQKTPLQIIQERVLLEARRLLLYTDKSIKEIAFDIGYEDIQTFSRFFKTKEGIGPKEFRSQNLVLEKLITY